MKTRFERKRIMRPGCCDLPGDSFFEFFTQDTGSGVVSAITSQRPTEITKMNDQVRIAFNSTGPLIGISIFFKRNFFHHINSLRLQMGPGYLQTDPSPGFHCSIPEFDQLFRILPILSGKIR
jgi:hypothetical protein